MTPCHSTLDALLRQLPRPMGSYAPMPIIAGVSGGADSVYLAVELAARAETHALRLILAHVHHGLRGADADADEELVRALAGRLDCPFEVERLTGLGEGNEADWREARHRALRRVAERHGATVIALGHHRADLAESFLLNAMRGTGPTGLAAMEPISTDGRRVLFRPLLGMMPDAIRRELTAQGIVWREDASNADQRHQRAALRHRVLPVLESIRLGSTEKLAESAERCADFRALADHAHQTLHAAAHVYTAPGARLHRLPEGLPTRAVLAAFLRGEFAALAAEPDDLMPRRPRGAVLDQLLDRLAGNAGDDASFSPGHDVVIHTDGHWLLLYRYLDETDAWRSVAPGMPFLILDEEIEGETPLTIGAPKGTGGRDAHCRLRAGLGPFAWRRVRPGERLALPQGSKSAGDAMKEARVPVALRPHIGGLYGGGKLLWIPGVRASAGAVAQEHEEGFEVRLPGYSS